MKWAMFLGALLLSGILVFALFQTQDPNPTLQKKLPALKQEASVVDESPQGNPPSYVLKTLDYILSHGKAPNNYVGGRNFQNRERRLKQIDNLGQKISYKEWDVHPKVKGKSRGAERLITGSDQSAYYTNDHYKSFIQIK